MKVCLCGQTSLSLWRQFDNRALGKPVFGHAVGKGPTNPKLFPSAMLADAAAPLDFACSRALLHPPTLMRWGIDPTEVVHVFVPRVQRKKPSRAVVTHSLSAPPPPRSILALEDGLCAFSPEFSLVEQANSRDFIDLLLLACEFCGCYSLPSSSSGDLFMRPPLTRATDLARMAKDSSGLKGANKVRKVIPHVLDGSGSPRETALALIFCLPKRLGGFGLPAPQLNLSLDLGKRGSLVWGKGNAFDAVWEKARVAVEYDGEDAHSSFEQAERDNARRNALTVKGYSVFVITKTQLLDIGATYAIASSISKRLGYRLEFRDPCFRQKHLQLRQRLLFPQSAKK